MTRSQFLRDGLKSLLGFAAEVVDSQIESRARKMFVPLHRPPGALDELSFLSKCTRCDRCLEACPHDAIIKAEAKYGAAVDTPVIRPSDTPCHLCDDLPCISACPEGALLPTENIRMGTAFIARNKCLSYNGQAEMCDYCFDRCPLKQVAIVMENRKPRVVEHACTGCGICAYFCPAPGKAIHVVPNNAEAS
jgi:ferredoxin-type protein NapG